MKKIERKIIFYTELLKILWLILIALTGALTSIFLNLDSFLKVFLFIIGFVLEIIVVILIREYNKEVLCLIEKLEDNK